MDIEQRAKSKLDEALSDVLQEILVIDEAGNSHLVYVHKIWWENGKVQVEFSTPDDNKEALIHLVHAAIQEQISGVPIPQPTRWERFKNRATEFLMFFSRLA